MDAQMIIGIASLITSLGTIAAVTVAIIALCTAKKTFHIAEKQFRIAEKSFLADHKRRKKQITIEFYSELSKNATVPLRRAISKALGEKMIEYSYKPIRPDDPMWIDNIDLQHEFLTYCRSMERFAVGISEGVFDFDTFDLFSGKPTAKLFEQIKPLIDNYSVKNGHDFCEEFKSFYLNLILKHNSTKHKSDPILETADMESVNRS